jgi:hypothetical protein
VTAVLARAHGAHHRPSLPRRILARLRPAPGWQQPCWLLNLAWHRQAAPCRKPRRPGVLVLEEARFAAWAQRVRPQKVPPAVAAQVRVDALTAVLHHADGPLPEAMRDPCDDLWRPHLARACDDTVAFAAITGRGA